MNFRKISKMCSITGLILASILLFFSIQEKDYLAFFFNLAMLMINVYSLNEHLEGYKK